MMCARRDLYINFKINLPHYVLLVLLLVFKNKNNKKKINNEKRCYITFQEKNYLALFLVSITLTTPF